MSFFMYYVFIALVVSFVIVLWFVSSLFIHVCLTFFREFVRSFLSLFRALFMSFVFCLMSLWCMPLFLYFVICFGRFPRVCISLVLSFALALFLSLVISFAM